MTTSSQPLTENGNQKTENCASAPPPLSGPDNNSCPQMARPLVWVTLAFILGLAAPSWGLRIREGWLLPGLALLWLLLGLAWLARRRVVWLPLAFFLLLGVAFYQAAQQPLFPYRHLAHLPLEQEMTLRARLERPSKIGPQGVQMFLDAAAWRSPVGWRPVAGKLLLATPRLTPPPVGTMVILKTRLRVPKALKNPGSFDRARYLAADGIYRLARLERPGDLIVLANAGEAPLRERLRGSIRRLLQELPPAPRAMYLAMLLGDQGEITPEMRQDFSRTGTSHLLVINGMHLGAVAAVTYFLCFWGLRRFPWLLLRLNAVKVSTLAAAVPVVAYAWMAGGSPSTQRAEVMVLAYLLLLFLGRPREVWSALALAALVILCLSPLRLYSIAFQLSFVAVAGLIYFLPRWFRGSWEDLSVAWWLRRWGKNSWLWCKKAAATSLVATVATAPLVALHFQVVSLLGAGVNLLAIPLVLLLALPLGEVAVLAQSLSLSLTPYLTALSQWLLALGKMPLSWSYQVIAAVARLPGSALIVSTPTWLQVAAYFLLWIFLFPARRRWWTWMGATLAGVVLAGTITLPLLTAPRDLEVTCLDTRGGLAGVVVSPEGKRLVFSAPGHSRPGRAGDSPGPLPRYLHWRQCRRLDQVMALELAQGNAPEMLSLAQQFTVRQFWYGRRGPEGPAYFELKNLLGDQDRSPRSLERDRPPPALGSVGLEYLSIGERKVGLRLSYQGLLALVIPPGVPRLHPGELRVAPGLRVAALIIPGNTARTLDALAAGTLPEFIVVYGSSRGLGTTALSAGVRRLFTSEGAVSLKISAKGVIAAQWRD